MAVPTHVRMRRARPESSDWKPLTPGSESEFRVDLERLRFAPSFARLAEVTQVVTPGATDRVVHNRLTHSIKVTAVARAVAVGLLRTADPELIGTLGGLDHVVAQAGAVAHDLGHPPFGHLGEQILDRIGREEFGLADGFEGNAQTWRILTELEVHGPGSDGLNLTAATRAAVLKYPWGRTHLPDPHPTGWPVPPRGAAPGPDGHGAAKFGAYLPDLAEMTEVIATMGLAPGRQSLECAVMDLADDIAYSIHDLEDFHRSGVLQYSPISGEFHNWLSRGGELGRLPDAELAPGRVPGAGLELLRRRLAGRDGWIFDADAFREAVLAVSEGFIDTVLILPYDGSMAADRALSGFTATWIDDLISEVRLLPDPPVRTSYATLGTGAWHRVQVLKFLHQRFVLHRPDLAMQQRGQARLLQTLASAFDDWLSERREAPRAPRRLLDLVATAEEGYRRVAREQPELLAGHTGDAELARMSRGRGVIDFIAGLTDAQATAYAARLSGGGSGLLWASGAL
ncbi:deoxyguanosinetriphosphate triphosphohydrolase family protein [Naumannella cuiyingiana]|uniref:dGTPase n=1 Tax=Naumannella cuiyingiana TaxID=1347891 RepID=A0A7Z0D8E8_9ACTN|nr:dNTP triphosphohydrolase [Naumannella cuiyingiana]NYI70844.1 dGTPase [Naumannella cuiyingiana]